MQLLSALMNMFRPSGAVVEARKHRAVVYAARDDYKTAARGGDVPAVQALLSSRRIALDDELDRGRGLLQFAVMVNSVKVVRLLISMGADKTKQDSLGASAEKLGGNRRNSSDAMVQALNGA